VRGALAPGALELQHDLAFAIATEPLIGDRGARDVAAQPFEPPSLMRTDAHRGVQAEAVRLGAQAGGGGYLLAPCHGAHAQHLLSRARTQGDSIRAPGRLQRIEGCVGADVGELAHALLFDEMAIAGEHPHEPHDELVEQPPQLIAVGGARCVKARFIPGAVIHAVEHQEIRCG